MYLTLKINHKLSTTTCNKGGELETTTHKTTNKSIEIYSFVKKVLGSTRNKAIWFKSVFIAQTYNYIAGSQ